MKLVIGIVGATGLAGQTALDLLEDSFPHFEVEKVRLFASRSSVGKMMTFKNHKVMLEETKLELLEQCHVVIFASESHISQEFIPPLSAKKILCIDKSSAYREDDRVVLAVPEVNGSQLTFERLRDFPVIATPNCCVSPLVVVLNALHKKFSLQNLFLATYQSVSGAGKAAMDLLQQESKDFFLKDDLSVESSPVFPKSIAFNVLPFVAKLLPNGDTEEEFKIINETRKVLDLPHLPIAAHSVRVPTFVGHGEAVTLALANNFSIDNIIEVLNSCPSIKVVTENFVAVDEEMQLFVTPREAQGRNEIFVSRVRRSNSFENGLSLWIVSDNLRKGAALNALQILDECGKNNVFAKLFTKR